MHRRLCDVHKVRKIRHPYESNCETTTQPSLATQTLFSRKISWGAESEMNNAQNKPQRPLAKQNTTSDWLFSFRERESESNFVWHHTSLDPDSLSRKLKSQSEVVFCLANGLCGLFCALVISDSAPHEIFLEKESGWRD